MTEEIANPATGAMTEADAIASLMSRNEAPVEDKPQADEGSEAEPAQEPETADDDAGDEPSEAAPEVEEPEPSRHKVKVAGEEVEVTLDELINGYSRQADYQRKTQALAEERKAVQAEIERIAQLTAQLDTTEKEPDWSKMAEELDPWEFNRQRTGWETRQKAKAEAARQAQELQSKRMAEIAQTEAAKLREKAPEWADPQKFTADFQAMTEIATRDYGFSPDEVSRVLDHRVMLLLKDAVEMRRLRQSKPEAEKRLAKAPKVVKPGSPTSNADKAQADRDALRSRLRKSGKVDDAVALLMARGR